MDTLDINDLEKFEPYLAIIFPLFFVTMWCLVLKLLSVMSGWARLAGTFETRHTFSGKFYRFQSARMKKVSFNSMLGMGVSDKGLYLCPFVVFRPFHKPLLIPWGEIKAEPVKMFFSSGYRLSFRSFPDITLDVSGVVFDKMIDYLKEQAGARTEEVVPAA